MHIYIKLTLNGTFRVFVLNSEQYLKRYFVMKNTNIQLIVLHFEHMVLILRYST